VTVPAWALRRLGRLSGGVALLGGLLLAVTAYASAFGSSGFQLKVTTFLVSVVMAVGLQIFSGNTGIISFGHMTFVGAAAYIAGLLTMPAPLRTLQAVHLPGGFLQDAELSFLPATLIAIGVVGVLAALAAGPLLRLPDSSAVIGIFALLLIAGVIFDNWQSLTHGAGGLYGLPPSTTIWNSLAWCVVAIAVARWFRDSGVGLELQASREDDLASASSGVHVRRLRAVAWVLSAMVSAVAGVLFAHQLTAFSPTSFSLQPTFTVVVMLVVGGMLTVSGAVIGAGLVTLVRQGVLPYESSSLDLGPIHLSRLTGLSDLVLVVMILLALYLRQEGLMGRKELDEHLAGWLRRVVPAGVRQSAP
jgi:branched-chain amino acid transport system permease protein